jgi:hypothetical protein
VRLSESRPARSRDRPGDPHRRQRDGWRDIGRPDNSTDAQAEIDALLPELQLA